MATGAIHVGIAGWVFPPWRGGVFYPKGLKQKDELAYAASRFNTLEINGTFYSLQKPPTFAAWAAATPPGFRFALKGPRFITHMKRLKDCRLPLANFLASGLFELGDRLGPILWQLPPDTRFDAERLKAFLALLPQDLDAAAKLASEHEPRLAGRAALEPAGAGKLRHALEPRHESFADPAAIALLRAHNVALVATDGVPEFPRIADLTADFAYLRLHMPRGIEGGYDDAALDAWAARVRAIAAGGEADGLRRVAESATPLPKRDVFLYCDAAGDEDVKRFTPANAATLAARLGLTGSTRA